MTSTAKPLYGKELTAVANLIDKCQNSFGPLPADVRARIFAAIDSPSDATWLNARSTIIAQEPETTLWQAVITGGTFPEATPNRDVIIFAIVNATAPAATRKALDK